MSDEREPVKVSATAKEKSFRMLSVRKMKNVVRSDKTTWISTDEQDSAKAKLVHRRGETIAVVYNDEINPTTIITQMHKHKDFHNLFTQKSDS